MADRLPDGNGHLAPGTVSPLPLLYSIIQHGAHLQALTPPFYHVVPRPYEIITVELFNALAICLPLSFLLGRVSDTPEPIRTIQLDPRIALLVLSFVILDIALYMPLLGTQSPSHLSIFSATVRYLSNSSALWLGIGMLNRFMKRHTGSYVHCSVS